MSAVDPQVASDIFHKCIKETLADKLVVLVTHQLQFLQSCENIMVIKDGKQFALGDYNAITTTGFNIEEILQSYNDAVAKNAEKDDEKNFKAEKK